MEEIEEVEEEVEVEPEPETENYQQQERTRLDNQVYQKMLAEKNEEIIQRWNKIGIQNYMQLPVPEPSISDQESIQEIKHILGKRQSTSARTWSDNEREAFIDGLRKHGKDWEKIFQSKCCPGRTQHALKGFARTLKQELMKQSNTKNRDVLRILGLPRAYLHTYFKEKECMTRQHKNWSIEEDTKLMKAMSNYGSDWKVIVSMFAQTKSKQQILDRV